MMKKLAILIMVAFLVALAAPALAKSYHVVYKPDGVGGWAEEIEYCEMFSKISDDDEYRWESAEGVTPGGPDEDPTLNYASPTPNPAVQFEIYNYAHVFPWIYAYISETKLIWDIFAPGDYMAKTFILQFTANCPVQVHLGSGTWDIPGEFVDGQNGSIKMTSFTKPEPGQPDGPVKLEDKVREYSLLGKDETTSPGTGEDEIVVRYWWHLFTDVDKPPAHYITDAEFALMPAKADWRLATSLNCESIIIPDRVGLHEEDKTHLVFYEDVEVEACDSEGKYLDVFAITITADP